MLKNDPLKYQQQGIYELCVRMKQKNKTFI